MIRKYFALSIVAASLALAGCSSDDDDDNGDTGGTTDSGMTDSGGDDSMGGDDSAGGDDSTGGDDSGGGGVMGVALGDPVFDPPTGSVVYVIDQVLMPAASMDEDGEGEDGEGEGEDGEGEGTEGEGEEAVTSAPETYTPTGTSVIDVARGTDEDGDGVFEGGVPELSSLVEILLPYGDLIDALDDETQSYTVFAPNNDALAALDTTGLTEADIKNVLEYHVVAGETFNTQAGSTAPAELTTVQGGTLTIEDAGDGSLVVVDAASAGGAGGDEGGDDTGGEGGDDSGAGGGAADGTALAAIEADAELSTFAGIVNSTRLSDNLSDITGDGGSDNYITLAPSNAALEGVEVPDDATNLVLRHITVSPTVGGTLSPGDAPSTSGADAVSLVVGGTEDALTINGFDATLITSGATPGGQVYKIEGVL